MDYTLEREVTPEMLEGLRQMFELLDFSYQARVLQPLPMSPEEVRFWEMVDKLRQAYRRAETTGVLSVEASVLQEVEAFAEALSDGTFEPGPGPEELAH